MTSVPDDIKNNILKLAKINDEDPKVLMGRLKEIMETDETIKAMKEFEHKIRFAWAKLYSEFSLSGDVKPCYIRPIAQPRPRKIEIKEEPTWVGELICVAQLIEKDDDGKETLGDPMYCAGTLWRDGAKLLNKLEKDKVYKSMLQFKENSWGATISASKTRFVEVKDGHTLPTFEDFYNKHIDDKPLKITINEMTINKAKHETDIRTMEVTVVEAEVGEGKDGNEYGRFTIMDESILGGNFTIFVAPEDLIWAQGSMLIFGGTINDDKGVERWNNHFILPTDMAMSREVEVKTTQKNAIDLSDDKPKEEEKKEEPEKKEEKKEEPKEEKKDEKETKEEKADTPKEETPKKEEKPEKKDDSKDDEGDLFKIDT